MLLVYNTTQEKTAWKREALQDYETMKDLVIIFIQPFDAFGEGRMCYTFARRCLESPDLPYDDGVKIIFLNTKGRPDGDEKVVPPSLTFRNGGLYENVGKRADDTGRSGARRRSERWLLLAAKMDSVEEFEEKM